MIYLLVRCEKPYTNFAPVIVDGTTAFEQMSRERWPLRSL
jgi:hypothetical protein